MTRKPSRRAGFGVLLVVLGGLGAVIVDRRVSRSAGLAAHRSTPRVRSEIHRFVPAEDQVVDQPHPDDGAGLFQPPGEPDVLGRRGRVTAWVRVPQEDAPRPNSQRGAQDRPGFRGSSDQRALEGLTLGDEPVPGVEVEGAHHLLVPDGVPEDQVAGDLRRPVEKLPLRDLGAGESAGQLQGGEHGRRFGFPDPAALEGLGLDADETDQATDLLQDLPGRSREQTSRQPLPTMIDRSSGSEREGPPDRRRRWRGRSSGGRSRSRGGLGLESGFGGRCLRGRRRVIVAPRPGSRPRRECPGRPSGARGW